MLNIKKQPRFDYCACSKFSNWIMNGFNSMQLDGEKTLPEHNGNQNTNR